MSASSSVPAIKCAGLESAEANIEKNERKKKYISAQWKIYSRTSSGVTFLAFEHGAKLHAQLIIINAHSNCGRAQYKHGTQCDFIASHNIKKKHDDAISNADAADRWDSTGLVYEMVLLAWNMP